jgi:hypothetical protein
MECNAIPKNVWHSNGIQKEVSTIQKIENLYSKYRNDKIVLVILYGFYTTL